MITFFIEIKIIHFWPAFHGTFGQLNFFIFEYEIFEILVMAEIFEKAVKTTFLPQFFPNVSFVKKRSKNMKILFLIKLQMAAYISSSIFLKNSGKPTTTETTTHVFILSTVFFFRKDQILFIKKCHDLKIPKWRPKIKMATETLPTEQTLNYFWMQFIECIHLLFSL
jgi:hypothetical protein